MVAYALAGKMQIDLTTEPLAIAADGQPVYLRDLWPTEREIQETMLASVHQEMFRSQYAHVFDGDERWQTLPVPAGDRFNWEADSTYIRNPPFFDGLTLDPAPPADMRGARVLALLGDSVTTDHISPAGSIPADSPAGVYLIAHGVPAARLQLVRRAPGQSRGDDARHVRQHPAPQSARARHRRGLDNIAALGAGDDDLRRLGGLPGAGVPLIVIAGKEYGSGSSRDWAAKGTLLLGVKAVIAESFERIHRSNLVNMGVLPLQFHDGQTAVSLKLTGREIFDFAGMAQTLTAAGAVTVRATAADGSVKEFGTLARIDTPEELVAYRNGGILPYVVRQLVAERKP